MLLRAEHLTRLDIDTCFFSFPEDASPDFGTVGDVAGKLVIPGVKTLVLGGNGIWWNAAPDIHAHRAATSIINACPNVDKLHIVLQYSDRYRDTDHDGAMEALGKAVGRLRSLRVLAVDCPAKDIWIT